MIKFVCSGPKPQPRLLRFFFHSNWDRLAELTALSKDTAPENEDALEDQFTGILQDISFNDVWKKTFDGRLPKTENAILCHLAAESTPANSDPEGLNVLDMGASDGITSHNLLNTIRNAGRPNVSITILDFFTVVKRYGKSIVREYRTSGGNPVLLRIGRLGLRLPVTEHDWSFVANWLARWYVGRKDFREAMEEDLTISLISPRVDHDPAVKIVEMDCTEFNEDMVGKFDVIRASNIISPRYGFCGQRLQNVLHHIHAYLRVGGCLVVSRNESFTEIERGSSWKCTPEGFAHVSDFGGGSEIADEVDNFVAFAPPMTEPRVSSN